MIPPGTLCELCSQPLDSDAIAEETTYCTACVDPIGSLFEILNYFKIPIKDHTLRITPHPECVYSAVKPDDDGLLTVPWPNVKDPGLYHKRACHMFPGWGEIVSSYKQLSGIKYWDLDGFRSLLEYIRERLPIEQTYEELAIVRRSAVIEILRSELSRKERGEGSEASREAVAELLGLEAAAPRRQITQKEEVATPIPAPELEIVHVGAASPPDLLAILSKNSRR
jgi:hypothetical protein